MITEITECESYSLESKEALDQVQGDIYEKGFAFIDQSHYMGKTTKADDYKSFISCFRDALAPDGVRNRAYIKLKWDRCWDVVKVSDNQNYYQTNKANDLDGGKVRNFAEINVAILENSIFANIIKKNCDLIKELNEFKHYDSLNIGVHFIQYFVYENSASFSSPVWLHIDDEPLVFVHLVNLSKNAIGGDNLIADKKTREIKTVIRLEKPLDTLCLTQKVYHAVTPLGSNSNHAYREVILFTVEPIETQKS